MRILPVLFLVIATCSVWAEDIKLSDGRILKNATMTAQDAASVTFSHDDGITRVTRAELNPAAPANPPEDVALVDGTILKNVTVTGSNAAYVTFSSAEGSLRIPFSELPPKFQERFGYDAAKADAFVATERLAKQEAAEAEARFQQTKLAQEMAEKQEAYEANLEKSRERHAERRKKQNENIERMTGKFNDEQKIWDAYHALQNEANQLGLMAAQAPAGQRAAIRIQQQLKQQEATMKLRELSAQ